MEQPDEASLNGKRRDGRERKSCSERPLLTCPHLGLPGDPETNYLFAVPIHRCHNVEPGTTIRVTHQQRYCLSNEYTRCPLYRAPGRVKLPQKPRGGFHQLRQRLGRISRRIGVMPSIKAARSRRPSFNRSQIGARPRSKMPLPRRALPTLSLPWPALPSIPRPGGKALRRGLLFGTILALAVAVAAVLLLNRPAWQQTGRVVTDNGEPTAKLEEQVDGGSAGASGSVVLSTPDTAAAEPVVAISTSSPTPLPTVAATPSPLPIVDIPAPADSPTPTQPQSAATGPAATEPPTATAPAPVEPTETETSANPDCGPPTGWVLYTVISGDTLFRIALRSGISLSQLQQANCLGNNDSIYRGQRLYVPRHPSPPVVDPSPTPETNQPTPTKPTATEPTPTKPTSTATRLPPSPTATQPPPTPDFPATRPSPTPDS